MIDNRLVIAALVSAALHFAFAKSLRWLPERATIEEPRIVQVSVVRPPPPPPEPEPEKPPEPKPEPPKPIVHERPQPKKVAAAKQEPKPVETPPVEHPPITTDTTTMPIKGISMESTSQGGTGPSLPVGNTTSPAAPPGAGSAAVKALAEPVAAAEVTKMPLPQGRCSGKYTDEAKAAAVEGVVVLDLTVDETGHTRDIKVVEGLPHGLTEAAVAALTACRFSPGEKGGAAVPVRIRGFKIRFVMSEGQ